MGQDYAEQICQAIDQIVTKKVEAISYDQTFTVTITDASEAKFGKYKVSDGNAEYYAYSSDTNYRDNERVYVTVPNGDFTQQKIIVGKYVYSDKKVDYNYIKPFSTIVDITGNLIEGNNNNYACELLANYPVELNRGHKIIKDRELNGNIIDYDYLDNQQIYQGIKIWEADFKDMPLTGYTRLGIKAEFKSYLSELNCISGNYGLKLITTFVRSASASEISTTYQAKEKIDSLCLDMPDALFSTYCEYHGLITNNQVTTINTKSDYNALIDKLIAIYQKHYVWLMNHGEELEISHLSDYINWNKYGRNKTFLYKLNDLQDDYIYELQQTLSNEQKNKYNELLMNNIKYFITPTDEYFTKESDSLAHLFLRFIENRQKIFELYNIVLNSDNNNVDINYYVNMSKANYNSLSKDYILMIAEELKKAREQFRNLIKQSIFDLYLNDIILKESKYEATYSMNLDTSQMIGDPYGLESYTEQEAIFSIEDYGQLIKAELYFFQRSGAITDSNTGEIKNLNFLDDKGNDIPYLDELELFGQQSINYALPNLFERNPYICIGYSLSDFDKESVLLYSLSSPTYSARSGVKNNLNEKTVNLRWIHKNDDNSLFTVNKNTTFNIDGIDTYPNIRWYRHKTGAPSPDEYAGVSWERTNEIEVTYEEQEEEVLATENLPVINNLQTFYLLFHGGTNEGSYSNGFTPEYRVPKTQNKNMPLMSTNNWSYAGYWTDECREKYHLSEELASHAFVGYTTTAIQKYEWQSWEDIFLSRFVYHTNHYSISNERYTGEYLSANDDHNGYKGYGCLHTVGFWEKLTMAYRLYHVYPNEFKTLGADDLFLTGGDVTGTDWDNYKNKNIYTDISYSGNNLYPDSDHNLFNINSSGATPLKKLFTLFANSFGEWGYVTDEYGMKDYRPVDDEVYERLYNASLYLFQKIDDPTYTHTEIVIKQVIHIPDYFHYTFTPDVTQNEERLKVIVICGDDVYESNEIMFTNEDLVANSISTDQALGLYLWCTDNTYGNYFIYNMNNLLVNEKQANAVRVLEARFNNYKDGDAGGTAVAVAERITWKIPYKNTMLIPYGIDLQTGQARDGFYTDAIIDSDENYIYITRIGKEESNFEIDPTIKYSIARNHSQTNRNNYIQCVLTLNGNSYTAVKEFSFGTMGTSGTDHTLVIDLDDNCMALEGNSRNPSVLNATARLYDAEGNDITSSTIQRGQWEWFWHPDSCGVDFEMGKILLDSGINRNLRLAEDYYDLDPVTGDYYISSDDVTQENYMYYYYRKPTTTYKYKQALSYLVDYDPDLTYYDFDLTTMDYIEVAATQNSYINYYVLVPDGTSYTYESASELTSYDNKLTYWKKKLMYEDTNFITNKNYSNYFVAVIENNETFYQRAENADSKVYYEIVPASKATKDTYQKYYILLNNKYVHSDTYLTVDDEGYDVLYYEPISAVGVNEDNVTNYFIHNINCRYIHPENYDSKLQYYSITQVIPDNTNFKLYYLNKSNTDEYYHPSDNDKYNPNLLYYQIRETTNVSDLSQIYIKTQLEQYEPASSFKTNERYYTMEIASAITKGNYKARVEQGIFYKDNEHYKQVILEEKPNYEDIIYYFISIASEVNDRNYETYYIKVNNEYVTPTEYNPNETYYRLNNEVNELLNTVQVGDNTASIACAGNISLNNFLILGVTLKNYGNYPLTAYLPIPIREVDEFEYVNLTLDETKVKRELKDYQFQADNYESLIASYNSQLQSANSMSTITAIQNNINALIQQAKKTQRTELFVPNTYTTLKNAISKSAIITANNNTNTSVGNYVYTAKKFCEILTNLTEAPTFYSNIMGMNCGAWTGQGWSFDSLNLIKSIIWGFNFGKENAYGGGTYCSNELADVDGDTLLSMCNEIKAFNINELNEIVSGELLYKNGNVAIFIGYNEHVDDNYNWYISCNFSDNEHAVQWKNIDSNNSDGWTYHGKLPWINYSTISDSLTDIDNSISGYETVLDKWDSYYIQLTEAENTTEINNAISKINELLSTRVSANLFEEVTDNILGDLIPDGSENYYSNVNNTINDFNKLYYQYFNEIQNTEQIIFMTSENSNVKAMAKAHLWGGCAIDLNAQQFSDDISQKYIDIYSKKYFINEVTANNQLTTRLNIINAKIENELNPIINNRNRDILEINNAIAEKDELILEKNAINDFITNQRYTQFSSIFYLFLSRITDIIPYNDSDLFYTNTLSYAQNLSEFLRNDYAREDGEEGSDQNIGPICALLNSRFISFGDTQRRLLNAKLQVSNDVKNIYKHLNQIISDELRYKQKKAVVYDLKTSLHAFYKAKEITDEQFIIRSVEYDNEIKRIDEKLIELQEAINDDYKSLEQIASDSSIDITIDTSYSDLLKLNIENLTRQRNEIISLINQNSTLLDAYDENNDLTYIKRQYGYIVGPTSIIYPSSGETYDTAANHNEPYQMFMFPNVETSEGYWKIYNPHYEDSSYVGRFAEKKSDGGLGYYSGIPYSNVLEPAAVFSPTAHQYGVQYIEVDVKDYAIPWQEEDGTYTLKILPGWEDTIDEEGNKILGLRSLLIEQYEPNKAIEDQNWNVRMLRYTVINNSRLAWTQPILTYQNLYPSGSVNSWDGRQLEMGDNYVLAAFMAAGKKNADNTFSGVMFGDYSQDPKGAEWSLAAQTGVYGFKNGAMSYAFKEDGTAFIGPAGKGRIQFDGNKGIIASAGYVGTVGLPRDNFLNIFNEDYLVPKVSGNQCGMMIDLDDSIIDMRGTVEEAFVGEDDFMVRAFAPTGAQVLIQAKDPYLKITTDHKTAQGNTIVNIGLDNYYIQSDNFHYNSQTRRYTGTKIDLKTGNVILAGDITWSGEWEDQQIQMLFSSGYINYAYVLDDTIIKGSARADSNHFTRSGDTYTLFTGATYQPNVEYYKLVDNLDYCYFTEPAAPKTAAPSPLAGSTSPRSSQTIDWWYKTDANGVQQESWPEHGIQASDYRRLLNAAMFNKGAISNLSYTGNYAYPVWHTKQSNRNGTYLKDNYVSYSYDQGQTWSDPQQIDGKISDSSLVTALLNTKSADGIYNNGGSIGIRAAAIRTGLLYSRESSPTGHTFETLAPTVGCVIDLDRGLVSLSKGQFFIMPNGLNSISSLQGKTVNNNSGNWSIYANGNFGVTTDGNLYATGANIKGTIVATGGKIANWTINTNTISASSGSNYAEISNMAGGYFLRSGTGSTENFSVSSSGKLTAKGADISGTVRVESLYIGNQKVTPQNLIIPVAFNVVPEYGWVNTGSHEEAVTSRVSGTYVEVMQALGMNWNWNHLIGCADFKTSIVRKTKDGEITVYLTEFLSDYGEYTHNECYGELTSSITVQDYDYQIVGYTPYITQTMDVTAWTAASQGIKAAALTDFGSYGIVQSPGTNYFYPTRNVIITTTGNKDDTNINLINYQNANNGNGWIAY